MTLRLEVIVWVNVDDEIGYQKFAREVHDAGGIVISSRERGE